MNETESGTYWMQLRNVIRSLREDVHVSQNSEHHLQMVAQLRWERLVAHNLTDMSFLSTGWRIRRSLFEANVPVVEAWLDHLLLQPTKSKWSHAPWSRSPQRCGARWRRQGTIRKGFINSTEIVSATTTSRCSIENFWPLTAARRNEARERTPCSSPTDFAKNRVPGAERTKTSHTSEDRQTKTRHISHSDICAKAVDYVFRNTCGIPAELHGRTAKTASIGIAFRQIPESPIVSGVENPIQKHKSLLVLILRMLCGGSKRWRWLILWTSWNHGDQLMDKMFQTSRCWTRDCLCSEKRSPRIRRLSASRSRKPKKRIDFFAENRSPSWSTTSVEWLALMTQYYIMLIYSQSRSVMTTFRNSIQDGTRCYCPCQNFHPMTSWKVCANWGYVSLINSKPYWSCTTWRFIRRYQLLTVRSWKPWLIGV